MTPVRRISLAAAALVLTSSTVPAAEPDDIFGFETVSTAFVSLKEFSSDAVGRVALPDRSAVRTRWTGFSDAVSQGTSAIASSTRSVRRSSRRNRDRDQGAVYAAFSYGYSYVDGGASGFNTFVGAAPFGDSHDEGDIIGGSIGVRRPFELFGNDVFIRAEVQGMDRSDMKFVTNSFPGFPAPPIFRYVIDVGDVWNVSGNLWLDIPLTDTVGVYTGFGLGVAGHTTAVRDQLPSLGTNRDIDYSYTIGAGFNFNLTDDVTLDLGWRFVDLGEAHTPLAAGGILPAGDHVLDMNSNEIMATVRLDLF